MNTQTKAETDLMRVGEVARMKGVSYHAVLLMIRKGQLHAVRIAGVPLLPRSEAERYMTMKPGRQKGWNKLERSTNNGHSE